MKKPAKRKPAKAKKRERGGAASGVDLDLLRSLLQRGDPDEDSLEDRIEAFLSSDPASEEDMPDAEAMMELIADLDSLRIDANGGDPAARETLRNVRELIDKAARRNDINPGILILLGKIFAQVKIDVGDAARACMGRMIADGLFHDPGQDGYQDLLEPLIAELAGDDFMLHEEVRCLIAIFPAAYRARVVDSLASAADVKARRCAAGFLLDPDEETALAAIRGLASRNGEADAVTGGRIALMRAWLPAARREALDRAFPATAAAKPAPANVVKTRTSACDGSGASSLIAVVQRGKRFDILMLLANGRGIVDANLFDDLSKSEAHRVEQDLTDTTSAAEASMDTWMRMLRLALGRNAAADMPPFELVRVLETLGIESAPPDCATPAEIIESLLAGAPEAVGAKAIGPAHETVAASEAAESWFEAGEAVEAVLRPTESLEEGAQAVLEDYLPRRRDFWARQCALTALALKDAPSDEWRAFALVGRDLAGNRPLVEIPLMLDVAEKSAVAYSANRR